MYAGHAAIALALKAREPRVPVAPLLIAAYGPDWAELVLGLAYGRGTMQVIAHSVPAVIAGGLAAAGLFALFAHRHGARYLLVGWLSHWPADYVTARKPLIDLSHRVGMDLYHRPVVDFAIEGALVTLGCVVYARRLVPPGRRRWWVWAMGAALVAVQGVLDFGLRDAGGPWSPLWR